MKASRIDTPANHYQARQADTLSTRVRRTAIAGAAAVALTGGGMMTANAATETVFETSAAEKSWRRIAGAAAKQSVPSVERAQRVLANAADKHAELVMARTVQSKQTKELMAASDAVLKAEPHLFRRGLGQAQKRLEAARANLDKATRARDAAEATHAYLAQEKAHAARVLWQNTADQLTSGAVNVGPNDPNNPTKGGGERIFTDASGISVDDFFSRIDRAIQKGKDENEKMAAELNKPDYLKAKDHEIAVNKRQQALLAEKYAAKTMLAKAPLAETAPALVSETPVAAFADVTEHQDTKARVAVGESAVVFKNEGVADWREWLNNKDEEIKATTQKVLETIKESEHATDEQKAVAQTTLTEVVTNAEQRIASSNDGQTSTDTETDIDSSVDNNVDSHVDNGETSTSTGTGAGTDVDAGIDTDTDTATTTDQPATETTEQSSEQPAEPPASQAVDPVKEALSAGVVLTQMANAAQQNADLFRKGMQDRLTGDDAFMQPLDIASASTGISTWAQAMGAQTTGLQRGNAPGFSMRSAGMTAGIDATKNNSRIGVAFGYGDSTADAKGDNSQNASSKVSTYSVGLYGAHDVDGWFVNGGVSYSAHRIKSRRTASLGGEVYGLRGKTNATTLGGFAQFGKHIVTPAVNIDPSITLKMSNTSLKGFTENGDAGLKVDSSHFNSARVGVGARLWKEFGDASRSITPSLRISYERELADAAPSMSVALANVANTGTITVAGNKLGRDIVNAEAGIDVKFGKQLSLHGGVNGSLRKGQTQAGVAGSLMYVW